MITQLRRFWFPNRIAFILLMALVVSSSAKGQSQRKVKGIVVDSLGSGIMSSYIQIISGRDTFKTTTDTLGSFVFNGLIRSSFHLTVSSLGYLSFDGNYEVEDIKTDIELKRIELKSVFNMLNEVEIKAKINPVILKEDTIEYNAAAYIVREHDRLGDLIKQLPGLSIDRDGEVFSLGERLVKIQVNGEDFFTTNVKEFLEKLPAHIAAKVQIIDDYGDLSRVTKMKVGPPQKIINIVTKTGKDFGKFGSVNANGGTNNQIGGSVSGNIWAKTKQISLGGGYNTEDNGAGESDKITSEATYSDRISPKWKMRSTYRFERNKSNNNRESFTETVNALGNIFDNYFSEERGSNSSNDLNFEVRDNGINIIRLSSSLKRADNLSFSRLNQNGLTRRDLVTRGDFHNVIPRISLSGQIGYYFGKANRKFLSLNPRLSYSENTGDNLLNEINTYYQAGTDKVVKDSILNRLLESRQRVLEISNTFGYYEPLVKPKGARFTNVDFRYSPDFTLNINALGSKFANQNLIYRLIDSLSTYYRSSTFRQNLFSGITASQGRIRYSIGFNTQYVSRNAIYNSEAESMMTHLFSVLPKADFDISSANGSKSLRFTFNAMRQLPGLRELQPGRDGTNLQNVIVGNPDLKPITANSASMDLSYRSKNGSFVKFVGSGEWIKNQIVGNRILLTDTLNSLKQQTTFENANGYYSVNGRLSLSKPFGNNKYTIGCSSSIGYTQNVFFTEGDQNFGKSLNLMHELKFTANQKWLALASSANYSFNGNQYTLQSNNLRDIRTWTLYSDVKFIIGSMLSAGFNVSKTMYEGYIFNQANPLLLNLSIDQYFFKNRFGQVKLAAFDIFDQGNNIKRTFTANSYTDFIANQITRYFKLSLIMRFERFGK